MIEGSISANHQSWSSLQTSRLRQGTNHNIDEYSIELINAPALDYFHSEISMDDRILLVLVGIPGSGKSHYSRQFVDYTSEQARDRYLLDDNDSCGVDYPIRTWQILCQDDLGTRKRVISHANYLLQNTQSSLIIDRCNFDHVQRQHWIDLASAYETDYDTFIHRICIVMPRCNDVEYCAERATARGFDSSHQEEGGWHLVCRRIAGQFVSPRIEEGFSAIYFCNDSNDLEICLNLLNVAHNSSI